MNDGEHRVTFLLSWWLGTSTPSPVLAFGGEDFPQQLSETRRQLPEDFVMRGLIWALHHFLPEFFSRQIVDEDERNLEPA